MTKDETGKLFTLLKQFYPNKSVTQEMRLAWEIVLEPYSYDDVKAAAVAYVRKNKFFPDIADLTAGLSENTPKLYGRNSFDEPASWMLPFIKAMETEHEHSISRYAREHCLTWDEAKQEMEGNGWTL